MNKKGAEFQFSWIFAVIIGAAIIGLAIYGVVRIIGTGQEARGVFASKELAILLNPLESSIGEESKTIIQFNSETRLYNKCILTGVFGVQEFSTSIKSGIGSQWPSPSQGVEVNNKYVFSENMVQGKNMQVISLPFNMPFKVADVLIIYADRYCFLSAPEEVKEKFESLKAENIRFTDNIRNCTAVEKTICFSRATGCNITVDASADLKSGVVEKEGAKMYFTGNLMYAGIFSSKELYECNVQRLIGRLKQLALLYKEKSVFLSAQGCDSGTDALLEQISTTNASSSSRLFVLNDLANELKIKNDDAICKIF